MADKFRGHHIVCTSLYEGKGYSGAFCENMTAVVERLRKDPDEELFLVAEPDMICANCPNKDRRVIEFFGLEENRVYTYREMCRHARAAMNMDFFMENCGKCDWRKQGLCKYEDLLAQLDRCIEKE